jgi:hypothetical protein
MPDKPQKDDGASYIKRIALEHIREGGEKQHGKSKTIIVLESMDPAERLGLNQEI